MPTFKRLKQEDFRWGANKFYTETLSQKKLMKSAIHLLPLPELQCILVLHAADQHRPPLVWPWEMGVRSTHCTAARGGAADVKVDTTLLSLY